MVRPAEETSLRQGSRNPCAPFAVPAAGAPVLIVQHEPDSGIPVHPGRTTAA